MTRLRFAQPLTHTDFPLLPTRDYHQARTHLAVSFRASSKDRIYLPLAIPIHASFIVPVIRYAVTTLIALLPTLEVLCHRVQAEFSLAAVNRQVTCRTVPQASNYASCVCVCVCLSTRSECYHFTHRLYKDILEKSLRNVEYPIWRDHRRKRNVRNLP